VTRNLIHHIVHYTHDASFFDKQTMFFFCSLFDRSMLCSFHFTHIHLNGPTLIYSFFFFIDSVGYRYFYRFQTSIFFLSLSLFFVVHFNVSLILSLSFFFSSAYFFPFSLYSVCVRVFKTMILFFRDRLL